VCGWPSKVVARIGGRVQSYPEDNICHHEEYARSKHIADTTVYTPKQLPLTSEVPVVAEMMSLELLVAVDDYCVTKVSLTAAVAGVNINVVKGLSHSDLMKFDIAAKSILLKTSSGLITQHVPILRYIAEIAPNARLMGANTFDSALVNQWLEFSWCELGMQVNNHHQNRLPNLIFSLPFSSRGPITTVASNPFRYL
jgi:hypothetical protein